MSEELKPCPACGASRGLYVLYDEHDMEWFVFCDNCKTSICNEHNDKREDAVRTWNRRAESTCRVESSHEEEGDGCYSYFKYELTCWHEIAWGDQLPPSYCPECGRRVLYDSNNYI